jgi:hypothetical protein
MIRKSIFYQGTTSGGIGGGVGGSGGGSDKVK